MERAEYRESLRPGMGGGRRRLPINTGKGVLVKNSSLRGERMEVWSGSHNIK